MNKRNTLFIGPFSPPFTGDSVKNSCLKDGFIASGTDSIQWFDTICRKGNRYLHRLSLIPLMFKADQIILSLNRQGRYAIIWIFYFLKMFTAKRALLYVVGGTFDQQVQEMNPLSKRLYLKAIRRLDGIFAESKALKKGLLELGLKNVELVYNPRNDTGARWQFTTEISHKAVFISRITEDKGVGVLLDALKQINDEGMEINIDFYGPIDPDYEKEFNQKLEPLGAKAKYCGQLSPSEVQNTLVNYHFLALPTFHFGEGLPGILVEAAMAGIPIIITHFNALPEYFEHEKSALLARPHDVSDLKNLIMQLIQNENLANELNHGILKVAEPFKTEAIISQSKELMHLYGWTL
ncbi:glycosyltransferase family 4 protein [Alkaliflexus imshenetskii]|uniref:glycosyltransferase family 4 protein n=1 Tax=Alkaliflexus imshenetskii TaxID=286730 RepID=UPI00047909CD|nr:glycosyltransferase [Alkaliflexus imshenetskii]